MVTDASLKLIESSVTPIAIIVAIVGWDVSLAEPDFRVRNVSQETEDLVDQT